MVDLCLDIFLNKRYVYRLIRDMSTIELLPILLTPATSCLQAIIGDIQGRMRTQFGNPMSSKLSDHLHGLVIAKGPIKNNVVHLDVCAKHL